MDATRVPAAVVAGHICLDITPDLGALETGALAELLRPGQLTRVGAADVHPGGCVANTGLALQLFGVPTRLIARVGDDAFGRLVKSLISASGANCALLTDPDAATSYSVVVARRGWIAFSCTTRAPTLASAAATCRIRRWRREADAFRLSAAHAADVPKRR
jgi:sugar/nucleoside kinase (ribokinase family)